MITAFTPRHWLAVLEATGLEERFAALAAEKGVDLSREEERYALRVTIEAELAPWFAARSLDEIGKALDAVGACWGPYQTVRQAVAEDPDLSVENPMFAEIEQPGIGRYLAAGSFIDFSGIPREPAVPAPTLGSNTESVLTEKLGLTDSDLSTLKDDGVI
jgi:2-methylfumaryl-CoA isomerase